MIFSINYTVYHRTFLMPSSTICLLILTNLHSKTDCSSLDLIPLPEMKSSAECSIKVFYKGY